MKITDERRLEFLKAHNDLRNTIMTIHECQDLWISDVGKLERLQHLLQTTMDFVPKKDDEGRPQYYADYVLGEQDGD